MFDGLLGRKLCDARSILRLDGYQSEAVLTKAPGSISAICDDSRVLRVRETVSGTIELIVCNPLPGVSDSGTIKDFQGDIDAAYSEKIEE